MVFFFKKKDQIKDLEKKYNKIIENASEIKKSLPDKKDRVSTFHFLFLYIQFTN